MSDHGIPEKVIHLPGEEISWVGACPWTGDLCVGTGSGKFMLLREGPGGFQPVDAWQFATEPINGVAFWGEWVGVSTRAEVVVARWNAGTGEVDRIEEPHFDGGAHGIEAVASRGFLAPLGGGDLLEIGFEASRIILSMGHIDAPGLNLYKVARLGASEGGEVFACAARRGGLLSIPHAGKVQPRFVSRQFPGLDLIDVCSLSPGRRPLAVAALAADLTLLLGHDIEGEGASDFRAFRLEQMTGKGSALMCVGGQLFVLTSREFLALPDLATQFLAGEPLNRPTHYFGMSIRPSDAYLLSDLAIGLLVGDDVHIYPINRLLGEVARRSSGTLTSLDVPDFSSSMLDMSLMQLI